MADCEMPYRIDVHASEGVHDSSASQQEHGCHQDIGHEAEEEECDVGGPAPARICTSTAISMSISSNSDPCARHCRGGVEQFKALQLLTPAVVERR